MGETYPPLPHLLIEPVLRNALLEDLGSSGDVTSRAVIPAGLQYRATLNAREAGVVSGMSVAVAAFRMVDPALQVNLCVKDGSPCAAGDALIEISGEAASILTAERVALNFAGRLSGIATLTAAFVQEAAGTKARITCTRKTTPGLRVLEKAAVQHGGGFNHRFSLADAILIKDNHIAAAGGVAAVLEAVKASASHMMRVEIEVDTLEQLGEVLSVGGADVVLLDNMSVETLRKAVQTVDGHLVTEASGNMTIERIAEVAASGVDYISVGALTHSAKVLDLGLDF